MEYVHHMSRSGPFVRRYGFDALIVARGARGRARGRRSAGRPASAARASVWFAVPAIALVVLPLLARRRFPFAAPAAVWLRRGGDLVRRRPARRRSPRAPRSPGMAAAFLLGNLRDDDVRRASASRSCSAARRSSSTTIPTTRAGELVFAPLLFGDRLAGGLRAARAGRAGRGGGGACGAGRARARGGRAASRSPRSARASRASSTTSSPTPSA